MKKLPKTGILFSPMEQFRRKSSLMVKLTSAFLVLILCAFQLSAQQHQVTGTVTEIDGVSLPGVNVLVEGTMIGAVTDAEGRYSLTAPSPTSILVVSFVGYTRTRVPIEGRAVIDVTLTPEFRAIDEIVVVGYGTRMREELTGSVSTMSGDRMEISTAPSVLGRLQGQVSGVTVTTSNTPGGAAVIRVRGLGTINNNEPLYIIDGVPSSPDNNLNPNDIESISILKDASSAAIYGTRGANGVVIITTKRGREGQRPTVNFNVRTGITQAVNQYDLLNTAEYGEMLWIEARNRGLTPGVDYAHPQYGDGAQPRIPNYILPAGAMSVDRGLYRYPDFPIFEASQPGTNWYDEIYRNGIIQEYDMSVTGGGENVTYSFSGSYLNEEGMLKNTGFERFTFRNTADARFNPWLMAGQSVQVINTSNFGNLLDNHEGNVISQAYRSQPIIPVYDIEGNFAGSLAPGMGNSGNPVAMHAGLALLTELEQYPQIYDDLERNSDQLGRALLDVFQEHDLTVTYNRVGSMLGFFFCDGPVACFADVIRTDTAFFAKFFHGMLEEGIYLPPSAYETWFVSYAHTEDVILETARAAGSVLKRLADTSTGTSSP